MKAQEVIFHKPVKVIQIFRNINLYGKQKKSFADRKDDMTWTDISSKSGYVLENELHLPEKILGIHNLKNCDLITIEDDLQKQTITSEHLINPNKIGVGKNETIINQCFNLSHPNKFDIFSIKYNENLELFLEYDYFGIGTPTRNNFKICDIKLNNPIEIKINGKTDHSLSSRRERVFKEQFYIIEYIGDFIKCKILKEPYITLVKQIPKDRKVIDLLKQLW